MKKALLSITILLSLLACLSVSCEPKASSVDIPTVSVMEIAGNSFTFRIVLPPGARAEWECMEEGSSWSPIVPIDAHGGKERLVLPSGKVSLRVRSVMPDGSFSSWGYMDPFRSNAAPSAPEVKVEQLGELLRFFPTSADPEGDGITFEIQVDSGASWKPVPDHDGWTSFVPDRMYDFRARALDTYGNASEWAPFSFFMSPQVVLRNAFPLINGWNSEGQARVIVTLTANIDEFECYLRKTGDTGPGQKIRSGIPRIDLGIEDAEAHGIMLEPGHHSMELQLRSVNGGSMSGWYPLQINVHAPEKSAFLRPVIFWIDSEEYRRAVKVVTDTGLTVAEMEDIERRYGSKPSCALEKDLGYDVSKYRDDPDKYGTGVNKLYFDDYGHANPIWSYIDDGNVLHIATTAETILPVKRIWKLFDMFAGSRYPGESMFMNMDSLIEADLRGFDFSSTDSLREMFLNCQSLETVLWDGDTLFNIRDTSNMFKNCFMLKEDPFPHEGTKNSRLWGMYSGCQSLERVDMSGLHIMEQGNVELLFAGCKSLTSVRLPKFMTPIVQVHSMFAGCESLPVVDLSGIEFQTGVDMNNMFAGMTELREITWDSYVIPTSIMNAFSGCSSLETLDLRHFSMLDDEGNICRFQMRAFQDCTKLRDGYIAEDGSLRGLWLNDTFELESNSVHAVDMFKGTPVSKEYAEKYMDGKDIGPRGFGPVSYPIDTDLAEPGWAESYEKIRDFHIDTRATLDDIDPVLL